MTPKPATPSRELNKLWREWIQLHTVLGKEMPGHLAAPFFSAISRSRCDKRILLVGKATDGEWKADSYSSAHIDDAIQERLRQNLDFVQSRGNGKAFWNFFCRLAKFDAESRLDSVIWSNVAKIGSLNGNPEGQLLSRQAELAEYTLRAEIREYRPALTIFVVGNNPGLSSIIKRALGTSDNDWEKDKARNVWWIQGPQAKLWTGHPERKPKRETEYWLDKAKELIGS